ncbi:MAG: ATP-binding cassette domain-containing protein [Gammaproteobacteria bacterium]|nr:ATP-binding cassette domain-containing protein [Gammaproteobacteria bacterium]
MTRDILINVDTLSRHYGSQRAVDGISFELRRGEVLGFLGPNGAGKSTTMRMITGNLAPSHGRITINGIDILDRPKAAKAHIGFLPEQPPLYCEFTVDEYLRYCARLHRITRHQLAGALDVARQRCGLGDVGGRLIGNLSKGYQQRVGIAQAIIHNPAVVVLDEPTVGLDPNQIREIRALIRELGNEHGVILSTHILPEVQATCDRVQIINNGQLVLSDDIAALSRQAQTSSLLLRLRRAPDASALLHIPHVEAADALDDGRWRIHHPPGKSPAAALAEHAVNQGWGLEELTPEQRSLEDIFMEITSRDASSQMTPEAA